LLKKNITYTSLFTDQPVTEEHYFHISKADLIEMEMEEHRDTYQKDGETLTGMQAKLQRIIDSQDGKAIVAELKDIIRRSYGKKDGDRFLKSQEISSDFLSSEAASELLFEICTNAETAAEFINGIIPGNLEQISAEIKAEAAKEEQNGSATSITGDIAAPKMEIRDEVQAATPENPVVLNTADVVELDSNKLQAGLADGRFKLS
jgi:hypothetical protein